MASGKTTIIVTRAGGATENIGVAAGGTRAWVQSRPIQIHPRGREVYFDGFRFEIERGEQIASGFVKFGWSDTLNGAINWQPQHNIADSDGMFWERFEGKYLHVYFEDSSAQVAWKLVAMEAYGLVREGRHY